jgi:lysozyme
MNKTVKTIGIISAIGLGGFLAYRFLFKHRMISNNGLNFLKSLEGYKNKAYKDIRGLWTIGVGHLIDMINEKNLLSKTLTDSEVNKLLDKDLDRFEKAVDDTITVPLNQHQKDALVSFAFNVGINAFKNSTLAKVINAHGSPDQIIRAFSMYRTPAILANRRAKEARLFLTGDYSNLLASTDFNKYFKFV